MINLNVKWALFSIIVITLMLTTATTFASPILAVKKSSSPSVKTTHKASSTTASTTPTAHYHIRGVKLLSVHTVPSKVAVGNTFSLRGSVFNNSTATITFANGTCTSPLSVTFNKNAVLETNAAAASCKAQQVTLKPGEHSQIISPNLSAIIYRATAVGTTNATMIFKYGVEIPTSNSPIIDTISRTYAFEIQPGSQQPQSTSTITTAPAKTTSEPGSLKLPTP
ncbi:MAG: hypothetical protein DLM72_18525 [Candidatus Nitrosopolaris wilkensis]|nr:MAG: hypothetical protein DLM72_18525 [Candidatus Nitrosopolaris wilkensis]